MAVISVLTITAAFLTTFLFFWHRLRIRTSQIGRSTEAETPSSEDSSANLSDTALRLRARLQEALPGRVISSDHRSASTGSLNLYWAQQACEVIPACVLRPQSTRELAVAVKLLKSEFDVWKSSQENKNSHAGGLFAIRGGGHSPIIGASSISGGVLIDMSLFNEVTPSRDGRTVVIGAGCKWSHIYETLEKQGLAVVGGRNSAVGIGGLTLGGGLSFFSPRFGFVCSNVVEYQVVLADGSVITASATKHPDLWRALKGGSNNFGIVTSFTANAIPSTKVWSGFLYMLPSQASKVLEAFHEYLGRNVSDGQGKTYDQYAAGPIACFTYLSKSGIQAIAVNLVHTELPEGCRQWPKCWRSSRFASLWRLWSTCKVRSLMNATDELHALNPPGRRQTWGTTTVKNDRATLTATHKAYQSGVQSIREAGIKDVSWTLVLQPLLPDWARKGQSNALGLDDCPDEPLVIVQFTVNWASSADDEKMEELTRTMIEQLNVHANKYQTSHRYRYLNYCGSWQKPFHSYGEANLEFLRNVSRDYDPDGLFQHGCSGGHKLGL